MRPKCWTTQATRGEALPRLRLATSSHDIPVGAALAVGLAAFLRMPIVQNVLPAVNGTVQQRIGDIFALWDELSALGARKSDAAMKLCMERLCNWVHAQHAFWVAIEHTVGNGRQDLVDPLCGWRVRAIEPLYSRSHGRLDHRNLVRQMNAGRRAGDINVALAAGAGVFRAYTLHSGDLVDMGAFRRASRCGCWYQLHDVHDRIWVAFPVNADAESVFCFDRLGEQEQFTQADLDLAAFVLRGVKRFHHELLLSYGIGLCAEPLTPSERRVIRLLIAGAPERAIATELHFSQGTVHQYATRIYQKFGAHGRTEFTAMWLEGTG